MECTNGERMSPQDSITEESIVISFFTEASFTFVSSNSLFNLLKETSDFRFSLQVMFKSFFPKFH